MVYNIFVLFSLLMLYLYYYSDYEKESCRKAIFFGMWLLFSIEFYSTRDFDVYYENFSRTANHVIWEPLYRFLLAIFQPFGFFVFNSCVAAFEFCTLYVLFKHAVPKRYFWIGICILILSTNHLFYYMCIKRQFLAICASLWILYFLLYSTKRLRYLYAIIAFICAINLHTGAYASIGYFILPFIRFRINIIWCAVLMVIYIASMSFQMSSYSDALFEMVTLIEDDDLGDNRYGTYIDNQDITGFNKVIRSIFQLAYSILLYVLLLLYNKKVTDSQFKIFVLSIVSLILENFLVGDLFRLNLFYSITQLFSVPILLSYMSFKKDSSTISWGLYWSLIILSLATPVKSYYNAMSGTKVTRMTVKLKHFYTIFDENPDKSNHNFEGEKRIK
ncbi:hypothetical protein E4T81_13945 [Barnesiella sp. WM24]|nr:hypothetical protein E4T81_13945 [Barnesiella sp. WM24]